jgi:serine/threonine protein kinase
MAVPLSVGNAADANLLFGVLALQLGFVSREQLIAAQQSWMRDQSRPLGDVLVSRNVLSESRRQLLEGLVREHLRLHANDPRRSLAALPSAASMREELQAITNSDLQVSLATIASAACTEEDPYQTQAPDMTAPPPVDRFRLLRLYARGGLGEVFVARDEELGREVALKEMRGQHADNPTSRARFVLEAEVTGNLEHPGVVPIYGLGRHADGRPYYAMRFIQGDSLKEAIEQFHRQAEAENDSAWWEPQLRKLVRRFLDVCNTIAYAHSRGVLHRDLKPDNIMLGKFGETLVVDWGLAKVIDRPDQRLTVDDEFRESLLRPPSSSDFPMTMHGSVLGTPAFMSPEQAAGQSDRVGPRSDVYSLGTTLYVLLTGRPPFNDKQVVDVLRRVQNGDFPHPRKLNAAVPPALEAICLKTMALRLEDRYQTAAELGHDIERWLDDRQVTAWPEPWDARLRRWLHHHRTLASATLAALLVALLSLGITTMLLTTTNDQLSRAHQAASQAKEEALKREQDAQEQREKAVQLLTEAREQRERAHFYLESFLNLERFGRSLQRFPLRKDFYLKVRLLNGTNGEVTRNRIAKGEFDRSQPFYISVEADRDCFLTVFYALPDHGKGSLPGDHCLLLFPNRFENDQHLRRATNYVLLQPRELFLTPVTSSDSLAYLYVVASERAWRVYPDGEGKPFASFSPVAARRLARQINAMVEETPSARSGKRNQIAEEIVIFNERSARE